MPPPTNSARQPQGRNCSWQGQVYKAFNLGPIPLSSIIFTILTNYLILNNVLPIPQHHLQLQSLHPSCYTQCYINMSVPLQDICLDTKYDCSFIDASWADHNIPDLQWEKCCHPPSENVTHYAIVYMTFQTTTNTHMTCSVKVYRATTLNSNNIILGTNGLVWNGIALTTNGFDLFMTSTTRGSVQLEQRGMHVCIDMIVCGFQSLSGKADLVRWPMNPVNVDK